MEFFTLPETRAKLIAADNIYEEIRPTETDAVMLHDLVHVTIQDMIKNGSLYDQHCGQTIQAHGKNLLSRLPESKIDRSKTSDDIILFIIHRILCELDFNTGISSFSGTKSHFTIVNENLDKFPPDIRSQLIYNKYALPSELIKDLLRSDDGKAILAFHQNIAQFDKIKAESIKEIAIYSEKAEKLANTLKDYEQAFNFVGLHDGFKNLHENKNKEKNLSFWGMIAIFSAMLLILLLEVISAQSRPSTEPVIISHILLITMPLVAIEILLIYLFRVVLANYQSIKKQLLQIELRMTLCQFIQSYTDYANKMKAADKASLEKFENLIFSGIVMDDQQLPSTFDGIEQISKMVSALKNGPKP